MNISIGKQLAWPPPEGSYKARRRGPLWMFLPRWRFRVRWNSAVGRLHWLFMEDDLLEEITFLNPKQWKVKRVNNLKFL